MSKLHTKLAFCHISSVEAGRVGRGMESAPSRIFFALKNVVFDHSVLAFGRRMENGEPNEVNSIKKALIT